MGTIPIPRQLFKGKPKPKPTMKTWKPKKTFENIRRTLNKFKCNKKD
jgi:hypothetical protein